jgi:TPR repeat protein
MVRHSRSSIIPIGISLAFVAQPVIASPVEDGAMAYAQGNYASAIQILRPLAEDGNSLAQHILGAMYADGQGLTRSNLHAYVWYSMAMSVDGPASTDFQNESKARDEIAKGMTSAEIKLAVEAVHRCLAQHYKNCD